MEPKTRELDVSGDRYDDLLHFVLNVRQWMGMCACLCVSVCVCVELQL